MKIIKTILALVVSALFIAACRKGDADSRPTPRPSTTSSTLHFAIPAPRQIDSSKPISCSAIASSLVDEDNTSPQTLKIDVTGKTEDLFAIQIKGNVMFLLTKIEMEAGKAQGDGLRIVTNSDNVLVADDLPIWGIHGFSLNKKTGMAVWVSSDAMFPHNNPSSEMLYMSCTN